MKDDRKPSTRSPKHFKFDKDREDWTDREIQMSQLYFLTLIQDATEKTRSNTSKLVWWLIALPIIFFLLFFLLGLGSLV